MFNKNEISNLTLYHFQACPFCARTRAVMEDLGLNIEMRDIRSVPDFKIELLEQGGKVQVPCLRIEKQNDETQWLYESEAVITFLKDNADDILNLTHKNQRELHV